MYELLPFWSKFFTELGFNAMTSPFSDRKIYEIGQYTIPSDTVCYPAKLVHGHIETLINEKADAIFYPDMTYNVDEGQGDDHFNCPVVAYYPQVILKNVPDIKNVDFICDFVSVANPSQFIKRITPILKTHFKNNAITLNNVKKAAYKAFNEYHGYINAIRFKADELIENAKKSGEPVIVLAGRPYHVDPEINHGIHELISRLGATIISEDAIRPNDGKLPTKVRNQWTYHARMYNAAKFVAESPEELNAHLVQLVSFGCGVDAVTTDEVRETVEKSGRLYSQIKIDEISNSGAVTIRLRSLMSVIELRKRNKK